MRGLLLALIVAGSLLLACGESASPQPAQPPATAEKPAEPPKAAEPRKIDRDGSTTVGYALAVIGTVIVMLLICVPARRE